MPERKITELYQEIKNIHSDSKEYSQFLEAMEELNTEMTALMKPDENGWKMLDKERFASLTEKYRVTGELMEVYLFRTQKTADPNELALREKVTMLGALLAADTAVLRKYRPQTEHELKSLPTLLEESRIPVMDQRSQKSHSVGGAQSSRFPMTVIGPDGRPLPGFPGSA